MLGWFVAHQGVPLTPEHSTVKLHRKSFPKKNTVFIMKDPVEKDEVYFALKFNDLMEIGGHYTYYEKNPCMQNYMISTRKKNGVCPSETVEDRAAKDFRSLVRTREEQQQQKRSNHLIYAVSACLVLIVIIMGVTTINNFDKMKSVQTALNNLTSTTSSDKQPVEAKETSGNVTAVTMNHRVNHYSRRPGKRMLRRIPDRKTMKDRAPADSDQPQDTDKSGQDADAAKTDAGVNGSDGVYVVEQGDTLAIISRKTYGDVTHVDAICKMNGLTDGNLIYVGQKLLLP